LRTIPHLRRVAAVVAFPIAVMLSGCGEAPSQVGSPKAQDLPAQGPPMIVESTTTVVMPVETLPLLEKEEPPTQGTDARPVFDASSTTVAIPVVTLPPPKDPVPLGSGDLASQFIGQVIQLDQNAKQVFVGQIALPPGSFSRGGMVVMGDDDIPTIYGLALVEIANRSKAARSLALILNRPADGANSPGPAITPPRIVVDVVEVFLSPGEQLVSWDCLVNGKPDFKVLAVAIDRRGTIPAIRAWRVEPVDEKIVEIDAASVVCELSQV
jgi:hypothetical protein